MDKPSTGTAPVAGVSQESDVCGQRRTHNNTVLVGFITCVALLLSSCGGSLGASTSPHPGAVRPRSRAAIPWSNHRIRSRIALASGYETAVPPCSAGDLILAGTRQGAYQGQTVQTVILENASSAICSITGFPTVQGKTASGAQVSITSHSSAAPSNVVLSPGDFATAIATAAGYCAGSPPMEALTSLTLSLPQGGDIAVNGSQLNIACGGTDVGSFVASSPAGGTTTGPLAVLVATLGLPSSVSPGSTLNYTVTLSNPSSTVVPLSPCPYYQEQLGNITGSEYQLNCAGVSSIPANGSVKFDMALAIPASAPIGSTKFGWFLNGGPGAGCIEDVT